jgi:hypothetical protein
MHLANESKPRYTPGPYSYRHSEDGVDEFWQIVNTEGSIVASILFWGDDDEWAVRAKADADLLAAAPEMLAALHRANDILRGYLGPAYSTSKISACICTAIAKAEGKIEDVSSF